MKNISLILFFNLKPRNPSSCLFWSLCYELFRLSSLKHDIDVLHSTEHTIIFKQIINKNNTECYAQQNTIFLALKCAWQNFKGLEVLSS